MSVLKNKRSLSKLEFFHNAIKLRKQITELLLRDFGIKDKYRKTDVVPKSYHMSKEDRESFLELCDKYKIISFLDSYPEWLIVEFRSSILETLRQLLKNITAAYIIYPNTKEDLLTRRQFQNLAIANCEQLLQEFQYIISIIPVDAEKYMPFVDMIQYEISLLRGWRKSDNKISKRLEQ